MSESLCDTPRFGTREGGRVWDNSDIKTAPIISRGLTAKTLEES